MKKSDQVGTIILLLIIAVLFFFLPRFASWSGSILFLLAALLGTVELFKNGDKK